MIPDKRFLHLNKKFWANIRSITQNVGYTEKGTKRVKVPNINEILSALQKLDLSIDHITDDGKKFNRFGEKIQEYYQYRADILNNYVEPRLMDVEKAKELFEKMREEYKPTCSIPMNKQSGFMKAPAYFTGIINMIIEANIEGFEVNYNPRLLTTFTTNGEPIRTFSRWMDGAFPNTNNPIAIWEIKEYYYATTFGSRVADAIYETQMDGMELEELQENTTKTVLHYLMIDSHNTWWVQGRPYLCRIIDMLHMGYLDEVLFGYEVVEKLPRIVKSWIKK